MEEHIQKEIDLLKKSKTRLHLIATAHDNQEVKNAHSFVDKAISCLENELRNPKLK